MKDYTGNHDKYSRLINESKTDYDRKEKLACVLWFREPEIFADNYIRVNDKESIIHNVFLRSYINNNINKFFEPFYKKHIEGLKYFNKNFAEKNPDEIIIKFINEKYNQEFKGEFLCWTDEKYIENSIEERGYKNGLLEGYIIFEEKYKQLFKKTIITSQKKDYQEISPIVSDKIISKITNIQAIGYLFTELINNGLIEPKKKSGNLSPLNIARMILEHFHFEDLEKQPKEEDLRKALFTDNRLSVDKTKLFNIPKLKQLNEK